MYLKTMPWDGKILKILGTNREVYGFLYSPGSEQELLQTVLDHVQRPDLDFNWLEGAVVSCSMIQHIGKGELEKSCEQDR